jgi:aminoglycoside phosphotransferase (APT) family kinase protein
MDLTDKPRAVRKGEELDSEKVGEFLKDSIPGLSGSVEIRQFPSGFSNLTYSVTVGDAEFVLRRPPFGTKAKTAHDMGREYRMLKALRPVFPYCPEPYVYTEDLSVIGAPFYVMERLRGIILRRLMPEGLELTADQVRRLCRRLLEVLTELHSLDYESIGLRDFGKPRGYVERQTTGWAERYRAARTPDAPDCEEVMAWIEENRPPDNPTPTVIHNDFRLDNVVLDENDPMRIIGVLDWEMATVGDPLMDFGNSMAYWIQEDDPPGRRILSLLPANLKGLPSRTDMVDWYRATSGGEIPDFDFYYCFGLFRLAVICQQIYYRHYHGQTKDERFGMLIHAVNALDDACRSVIAESDL